MAKPKTEELTKHTLNLRSGDLQELAVLFPKKHPSVMVREIISKFIDRTKFAAASNELSLKDDL